MTDPGSQTSRFDGLPREIGALCRVVQGVLLHSDWIAAYGLPASHLGPGARDTLPLSRRLVQIADADARPLTVARAANVRAIGTCRDYALMLCGILRQQEIPARIRCGFAAYLVADRWEDHWICEYRLPGESRWRQADAQIDDLLRQRLAIQFDTADLPPNRFVAAGDAWRLCRTAQADPAKFGHGTAQGLWFMRVNVVRDHFALNESETSVWDSWRQDSRKLVSDADKAATDLIARDPGQAKVDVAPPWLA